MLSAVTYETTQQSFATYRVRPKYAHCRSILSAATPKLRRYLLQRTVFGQTTRSLGLCYVQLTTKQSHDMLQRTVPPN